MIDDLRCPCGEPVEPLQDDDGVFLQCVAACGLVDAAPAHNVEAAIDAWQAALPLPSLEDALELYAHRSAGALLHAQTPQELIALAPLAHVLISYLQRLSLRPAGDSSTPEPSPT